MSHTFILLYSVIAQLLGPYAPQMLSGVVVGKPPTTASCPTGTYVTGAQETFECSVSSFYTFASGTTPHALTDANSRVSIYDSSAYYGPTHSLGIDLGANESAYVETDLGGTDNRNSWAFWFYAPSFGSDTFKTIQINEAKIASGTPGSDPYQARVGWRKTDPTYYFTVYNASGTTQSVTITTTGAWYELQVDYTYGGNIVLSVWDSGGTAVGTATVAHAGGASGPRYIYHGNFAANAGWNLPKTYFDDLKYNASGGNVYSH